MRITCPIRDCVAKYTETYLARQRKPSPLTYATRLFHKLTKPVLSKRDV